MLGMTRLPVDTLPSQAVTDLEVAARELHILRRALHPEAASDGLSERLRGYAAAIEATFRANVREQSERFNGREEL